MAIKCSLRFIRRSTLNFQHIPLPPERGSVTRSAWLWQMAFGLLDMVKIANVLRDTVPRSVRDRGTQDALIPSGCD